MEGNYEFERLGYVEKLIEEYKSLYGTPPFALSHWDPSEYTMNLLLPSLSFPSPPLSMPYIYSHQDSKEKVLKQLGFIDNGKFCSYVQTGTNAILLVACWLKSLNINQVLAICPTYFSAFYAFKMLDLPYKRLYMYRNQGNWHLPQEQIVFAVNNSPLQTAVWITNPVYSTSNYQTNSYVEILEPLLKSGVTVVVDECLCLNGRELGSKLAWSDRFIGIYSPHKSVCVNAVKFAAVVADEKYEDFFDNWADVLVGGLSASNYSAILHFLGNNFPKFRLTFIEYTNSVRNRILNIINPLGDVIETDANVEGQYITLYARKIDASKGNDTQFLRKLMLETGAIVIPGVVNHFPKEVGFCFRVNLARGEPQFFSSLQRLVNYLASISS